MGVGVGVGACGVYAGRGGEKVSLAALLSGCLGKSGHLPRYYISFREIPGIPGKRLEFFGISCSREMKISGK